MFQILFSGFALGLSKYFIKIDPQPQQQPSVHVHALSFDFEQHFILTLNIIYIIHMVNQMPPSVISEV